ncbi:MAG: mercuric transport protein MerTP [Leadbetterella sp.]|jgi:copper chaperone CopZ|nr:mercuric transport protein MerTP [Leadbetterella sp.]
MKTIISLPNLSIITALASSLCCIMPVLAILAGTTGIASTFSWLDPVRPYFIGSTTLILSFAWYQKLKPDKQMSGESLDCNCEADTKMPFFKTKTFLTMITILSILLLSFPSYSHLFFQKTDNKATISQSFKNQKIEFTISGMTCTGCEVHVKSEISKLKGIILSQVSYEKGNAIVKFDNKKTNIEEITKAINSTGYKVVNHKKQF